jgi:hypothetical protein
MHKTLPSHLKLVGIGIGIDLETFAVKYQLLVLVLNGFENQDQSWYWS